MDLQKLNCMNYQIHDADGEYWFAQSGLRSLFTYAELSDTSFRDICTELLSSGQIVISDNRDNDNSEFCITMI